MRALGPRACSRHGKKKGRKTSSVGRSAVGRADYPMNRLRPGGEGKGARFVRKMIAIPPFVRREISRWIYAVFLSASTVLVLKLISYDPDIPAGTHTLDSRRSNWNRDRTCETTKVRDSPRQI